MPDASYWNTLETCFQAIVDAVRADVHTAMQQTGLSSVKSHWSHLIHALSIHPHPLDAARLERRNPYNAPKRLRESLQILAARGYLKPVGAGRFALTDQALAAIEVVVNAQRDAFARLDAATLPAAELAYLRDLLRRLCDAARSQAFPHPGFDDMLGRAITDDQPLVEQIGRYFSLIAALREDAHAAGWRALTPKFDGIGWQTLTCVWRGDLTDPQALAEGLASRGYSEADYRAALKKLVKAGWLKPDPQSGTYEITPAGRAVRERAEATTDALFFSAWDALSPDEHAHLRDALMALAAQCAQNAPGG